MDRSLDELRAHYARILDDIRADRHPPQIGVKTTLYGNYDYWDTWEENVFRQSDYVTFVAYWLHGSDEQFRWASSFSRDPSVVANIICCWGLRLDFQSVFTARAGHRLPNYEQLCNGSLVQCMSYYCDISMLVNAGLRPQILEIAETQELANDTWAALHTYAKAARDHELNALVQKRCSEVMNDNLWVPTISDYRDDCRIYMSDFAEMRLALEHNEEEFYIIDSSCHDFLQYTFDEVVGHLTALRSDKKLWLGPKRVMFSHICRAFDRIFIEGADDERVTRTIRERDIVGVFSCILALNSGFCRIAENTDDSARRFFCIAERLGDDLQQRLTLVAAGSAESYIPYALRLAAAKEF